VRFSYSILESCPVAAYANREPRGSGEKPPAPARLMDTFLIAGLILLLVWTVCTVAFLLGYRQTRRSMQ